MSDLPPPTHSFPAPPLPETLEQSPEERAAARASQEAILPSLPGYMVLRPLGRGGMGVVYLARQLSLDRVVALKRIRAEGGADGADLARFRTEAEAVARLQHPQIVQIYEVGEAGGLPYLSLEYCGGGTLAEKVRGEPQPPDQTAALVEALARAIEHAHRRRILHRDLKPGNILLTEDGVAKISDFGLAKKLDDGSTQTGHGIVLGTPSYMAPEQARGDTVLSGLPAVDIYALGAILYELLTGRPPFKGPTADDTRRQVLQQEPVPPRRLVPSVPRDLETICLKCLRKAPQQRYATASDLADDLHRFQSGEPIRARPVSLPERAARWVKRHRVAAGWGALATIVLVVSLLAIVQHATLAAKQARATAEGRLQQLRRHHEDAVFHAIRFTEGSRHTSVAAVRRAARDGLSLFGLDDRQAHTPDLRGLPFGPTESEEVREDCYELLLLLAEALSQPLGEEQPAVQATQALERVDQAEQLLQRPTRAARMQRAVYLARSGDAAAADLQRRRAEDEHLRPAAALDHLLLGWRALTATQPQPRELEDGVRHLKEALRLQPDHFWAAYLLAVAQARLGRPDLAQLALLACRGRRPDFVGVPLLAGFLHTRLGDYQAAADDFRRAEQLATDNDARWVLLVNRGVLHFQQQQQRLASSDFTEAIHCKPEDTIAYRNLVQVLRQANRLAEAQAQLDTAIRVQPGEAALYRERAELRRQQNDPAGALADLNTAVALEETLPAEVARCQALRAEILLEQGRTDDALAACDAALSAVPTQTRAVYLRANCLVRRKEYRQALDSLNAFLKQDASKPEAWLERGLLRVSLQDPAGALADFSRGLDLAAPADLRLRAELHLQRGAALLAGDAPRLAEPDLDEAIRLGRATADAYAGRGYARARLGRPHEAALDADRAVQLAPETSRVQFTGARTLALAAARLSTIFGPPHPARDEYRARALEAIRRAVALLSPPERAAFWQTTVVPDTDLASLRSDRDFLRLAESVR